MTYHLWLIEVAATGESVMAWLKFYDPNAYDGRGNIVHTSDRSQALSFPDFISAMECWRQISTVRPVREDGRPNRPLSAFTVMPVQAGEDPFM